MDEKLKMLENKMNILEEKYPNIIQLWKKYIQVKKESLKNGIEECEKALKIIKMANCDLNSETITILYFLNNRV
jgi:hypothetical protein